MTDRLRPSSPRPPSGDCRVIKIIYDIVDDAYVDLERKTLAAIAK